MEGRKCCTRQTCPYPPGAEDVQSEQEQQQRQQQQQQQQQQEQELQRQQQQQGQELQRQQQQQQQDPIETITMSPCPCNAYKYFVITPQSLPQIQPSYDGQTNNTYNSGHEKKSAEVLFVEPYFNEAPSEYDIFYDCVSKSEFDIPQEGSTVSKPSAKLEKILNYSTSSSLQKSSTNSSGSYVRQRRKNYHTNPSSLTTQNRKQSAHSWNARLNISANVSSDAPVNSNNKNPFRLIIDPVKLSVPIKLTFEPRKPKQCSKTDQKSLSSLLQSTLELEASIAPVQPSLHSSKIKSVTPSATSPTGTQSTISTPGSQSLPRVMTPHPSGRSSKSCKLATPPSRLPLQVLSGDSTDLNDDRKQELPLGMLPKPIWKCVMDPDRDTCPCGSSAPSESILPLTLPPIPSVPSVPSVSVSISPASTKSSVPPPKPARKKFYLAYPQHQDLKLCAPCCYNPSPLMDSDGNVFCPYDCGCCLCPWKSRRTEADEIRLKHEKIKVCRCRKQGTIFTDMNVKEACSRDSYFDVCPCREKAESVYLQLFGQEMWTVEGSLNRTELDKQVTISECVQISELRTKRKKSK